MANVLIRAPAQARLDEVFLVSAMIAHPMETGFRAGNDGRTVARNILRLFSCHYGGVEVFSAELYPAVAANPYLSFYVRARQSADLVFRWQGDHGFDQTETRAIVVSAA